MVAQVKYVMVDLRPSPRNLADHEMVGPDPVSARDASSIKGAERHGRPVHVGPIA